MSFAPLVALSALKGEQVKRLFTAIEKTRRAATEKIGTGPLNRLLHAAVELQPPPTRMNRRFKLLYATQLADKSRSPIPVPAFLLFVNDPGLLVDSLPQISGEQIARDVPLSRVTCPAQAARARVEGRRRIIAVPAAPAASNQGGDAWRPVRQASLVFSNRGLASATTMIVRPRNIFTLLSDFTMAKIPGVDRLVVTDFPPAGPARRRTR